MELKIIKPKEVKIINITTAYDRNIIYGLGDDSQVYFWLPEDHLWQLWG